MCAIAEKHFEVTNVSSIDPIKKIARENGWNGEKDNKSRKFLSDLKKAYTDYNDLPTNFLLDEYRKFTEDDKDILFCHIREPQEIEKFKKAINYPSNVKTLLIRRPETDDAVYGNESDDDVDDYDYDIIYENSGTIEEAEASFTRLLKTL